MPAAFLRSIARSARRRVARVRQLAGALMHPLDLLPFDLPDILAVDHPHGPAADFSVHMLLCHRHVPMALWSLKSFTRFAGLSPVIVIHDDGTLTPEDRQTLVSQLHRCTVVRREDADGRMDLALRTYPACREARATPGFYCSLKLFDPPLYAPHDVFVLLDSDVLFFRHPAELLLHVNEAQPCFNSDYQSVYSAPIQELSETLKISMIPRVNAGLVVLRKADCDLEFCEEYFRSFRRPIRVVNVHEQTMTAALLSRAGAARLGPSYQISRRRIEASTVSHHFVDDGSRGLFFRRGVRILTRRGFA